MDITEESTLHRVRPSDIAGYLRVTGWTRGHPFGRVAWIWTRSLGGQQDEVLVPTSAELGDYAVRVSDILRELESVESRSQADILADIEATSSDTLRVALRGSGESEGTVALTAGRAAIAGAEAMLLAAACSTVSPRAYYRTRRPTEANDFLGKVRLGQTGRGSFVLAFHSRVPPADIARLEPGVEPVNPSESPFSRRVMATAVTALKRVREAAESVVETGSYDLFITGVEYGVSANLCEAILQMEESGSFEAMDFRFSWAPVRPPAEGPSTVTILTDHLESIGEAARLLKAEAPPEQNELEGVVSDLHRNTPEQESGRITIYGVVDGEPRKVSVRLARADYQRAIQAHDLGLVVYCAGPIERRGPMFLISNPSAFRVRETPG